MVHVCQLIQNSCYLPKIQKVHDLQQSVPFYPLVLGSPLQCWAGVKNYTILILFINQAGVFSLNNNPNLSRVLITTITNISKLPFHQYKMKDM